MNIEDEYNVELISMTQARAMLGRLPEMLAKENRAVVITRRGKPVLVVIPWDLYESIMETMEIMEDAEMMDGIRQGIEDMREGNLVSHEKVMEGLGD